MAIIIIICTTIICITLIICGTYCYLSLTKYDRYTDYISRTDDNIRDIQSDIDIIMSRLNNTVEYIED